MRLVDFCNPHFKDEHSSHAWIPKLVALENRAISRRPVRFARLDHEWEGAVDHHPSEGAGTLTFLVVQCVSSELEAPPDQDQFHQQPVKAEGFHGPKRLLPASDPPRTLPPTVRCRATGFSTPFHSRAVSLTQELGPRPPPRPQPKWLLWAQRLLLTSATNTVPEHTDRAHEPRPQHGFPTAVPLRVAPRGSEQYEPETEASGRRQSRRHSHWPRTHEPACTQRCRGPLEGTRAPHCRHFLPDELGEATRLGKRPRLPA